MKSPVPAPDNHRIAFFAITARRRSSLIVDGTPHARFEHPTIYCVSRPVFSSFFKRILSAGSVRHVKGDSLAPGVR